MKDDSFDCTLIAHLRIFLLFYRLLYCLILPENRLFFGIWKVVEIEFAVIISQSNGKWVFCKHKERDTYEVPGGHREAGEDIFETAKRELQEETGAIKFEIKPICVYSVTGKTRVNDTGEETFGLLCFAEITEFAKELHSEMEKVVLMDELPENWTYPLIQPKLIEKYLQVKIIL